MPRKPRATPGGIVYHVLNRANAGLTIFRDRAEYAAFEQALAEARDRVPMRVVGYCLMPNHWHLVVWPRREHDLSEFMRWLTVTHTRRWHAGRDTSGSGHLYQGRYRSFPVEAGEPLLTVLRYVESNPRRSKAAKRAEEWPWSSLFRRASGHEPGGRRPVKAAGRAVPAEQAAPLLDAPPTELPRGWVNRVNAGLTSEELKALRNSVRRGTPFGSIRWRARVVARLGLEHTLRPPGRPPKAPPAEVDSPAPSPAGPSRQSRKAATPAPPAQRARKAAPAHRS